MWRLCLLTVVASTELRETLQRDDECGETCALNALQMKRCFDYQHEVKDTMLDMAKQIEEMNDQIVVLVAKALRSSKKDDFSQLIEATAKASELLEKLAPSFILLTNKTSAVHSESGIIGKAGEEQAALLRMQRFMQDHAGEVLMSIAQARKGVDATGFAQKVNKAAQEAGAWMQGVLKVAWSTATDQLPHIKELVNETNHVNATLLAQNADCAADTARSISSLTSLYAKTVQSGTDCDTSNATLFSIADCESSALSVQVGITEVIEEGAKMMQSCYKANWGCAQHIASASKDLLASYMSLIVLKSSCTSSDPIALAVCESEAFTLSSTLGVAAGAMHTASMTCKASCT